MSKQVIPKRYREFMQSYSEVGAAYEALGDAVASAGPLDAKTRALVKLGMSLGARMEGAAHSQARKAIDAGATADEIRHAALQATTTLGFPQMMAGLSWIEDVLNSHND